MSEQNIPGLPVAGYRPTQTPEAIEAVNAFKRAEERLLRQIERLAQGEEGLPPVDGRFLAIGKTALEQAFMALNRAIFRPERITLPEDTPAGLDHVEELKTEA